MSNLEHMSEEIRRQYTGAYGPLVKGDYSIGDTVSTPGTSGEIIWSYQGTKGFVYVVDDGSGFPVEIAASEVQAQK